MCWREHFKNAARKERWTWAALSRETGIPRDTIQKWMQDSGGRGEPPISKAIQLAKVMNMGLDELFLGVMPATKMAEIIEQQLEQAPKEAPDDSQDQS